MSHENYFIKYVEELNESDIKVLNIIWNFFCAKGKWPSINAARKNIKDVLGKDECESVLSKLESIFVLRQENNWEGCYQLSFEGIYVVEKVLLTNIVCKYFDYIKNLYNQDPDVKVITSEELSLIFTIEELVRLRIYISIGRFWGRTASGLSENVFEAEQKWEVGIIDNIELLDDYESSSSFLLMSLSENVKSKLSFSGNEKKTTVFSMYDTRRLPVNFLKYHKDYISLDRIEKLLSLSSEYDYSKLCKLLLELNDNYRNENYYSCGMVLRAVIDHVPPVFDKKNFVEVANNYGTKSFKESTRRLDESLRKISDSLLHTQIRKKEELIVEQQVRFIPEIDVLLEEIIRISSK
jgi:hypothetical protein